MKIDERFKKQAHKKKKLKSKLSKKSIKNSVLDNAILKVSLEEPLTLQEATEFVTFAFGTFHIVPKILSSLKNDSK